MIPFKVQVLDGFYLFGHGQEKKYNYFANWVETKYF